MSSQNSNSLEGDDYKKESNSSIEDSNDSKSKDEKDSRNKANGINCSIDLEKSVYQFKIILIGCVYVGKTSIFNRCIENRYSSNYKCNVGVEFKVKSLDIDQDTIVDLKIWDTCGDERYRAITRQYYNNTDGVLLIFDITDKNTFYNLEGWYNDVIENTPKDVCVHLVGNKIDLDNLRKVSTDEGLDYAKKHGIKFTEVSAKTGNNIHTLFDELARDILKIKKDKNNIDGFKEELDNIKFSKFVFNSKDKNSYYNYNYDYYFNNQNHKCC